MGRGARAGKVPCSEGGRERSSVRGEKLEEETPSMFCQRRKWTDLVDQDYSGSDGSTVGDVEARDEAKCLCCTM